MPLGRSSGIVNSKATGQPASSRSSRWKWIAPYSLRRLAPVGPAAAEVVAGDAARRHVDERPSRPLPEMSRTRSVGMSRPKSQAPTRSPPKASSASGARRRSRPRPRPSARREQPRTVEPAVEVDAVPPSATRAPRAQRSARRRSRPPSEAVAVAGERPVVAPGSRPAGARARHAALDRERHEAPLPARQRGTRSRCGPAPPRPTTSSSAPVVETPAPSRHRRMGRRCSRSPARPRPAASAGRRPRT